MMCVCVLLYLGNSRESVCGVCPSVITDAAGDK